MRCFFVRDGRIAGVEMLTGLSDQDAIAKAHKLFFLERCAQFDGFEVWDGRGVASVVPRSDVLMAWCAAGVIEIAIMAVDGPAVAMF